MCWDNLKPVRWEQQVGLIKAHIPRMSLEKNVMNKCPENGSRKEQKGWKKNSKQKLVKTVLFKSQERKDIRICLIFDCSEDLMYMLNIYVCVKTSDCIL